MKKLVLIALFTAFCLNLANAYDSYSNESLIVIPDNSYKYKKRRHRDRYDDDVVIYMDPPYGGYRQTDRGRDYRDKLVDQYIKNNNIKKGGSNKSDDRSYDRSYERGYDDGYDDGYRDRRDDYYYSPRPQVGIRVR